MKIKVSYIEATTIEQLQDLVDRELEALQLNIKNKVAEVKTIRDTNGYVAQIVYMEIEDIERELLKEGESINVLES